MKKEDFQEFFKQRMAEIMHKDTLDSYRVRANNAHTILKELGYVMEGWIAGNIKRFETVELCINETISLVEKDNCLVFTNYSKELFLNDLDEYNKKSKNNNDVPLFEDTNKIIYLVNECLTENEGVFLSNLIEKIEAQVTADEEVADDKFSPNLREFDNLLSSFACELLMIGYSKRYLYKFFNSFKKNLKGLSFEDAFEEMKQKFRELQQYSFSVVINLSFKNVKNAQAATEAVDWLNDEMPEEFKNIDKLRRSFIVKNKSVKFYIEKFEALDAYMAVRLAYEKLSKLLDFKQDVISGYALPSYALSIMVKENGFSVTYEKFFELDNGGQFLKVDDNMLFEKLSQIEKSELVLGDVKDRITAALRHLRIGDGQVELEQQFINYWIALEFIFASSSSKDSTYSRIKENLVNILSACYVKRNILYLENWMKRDGMLEDEENLIKMINGDEKEWTLDKILLKFRFKNMKSHLHHKDKIKKYIDNHETHLLQHISRIYRLRNELVHEAALKQDIENVASNLRFYLVFVLNQMIDYFSDKTANIKPKSMLQFFWNYEKCLKAIKAPGETDVVSVISHIHIAKSYIV
ncbi:hypothetical protein [Segatella hominis]|uniref:hypothetical protein n=2 Tax=Segatella hominis TaxID=2518605 RepID=UPI003AAE83F0